MNVNSIFIYPTDTIYGLGCNAENAQLVERIRLIKKRDFKPFSVIAPSFSWILENCETNLEFLQKYLPGPYTLILKKKKQDFLKHVSESDFLGVRIPSNDFTKELQKSGKPIITTSVNVSGEPFALSINEVKKEILDEVDWIIDKGKLSGKPSTIIFGDKVIER